MNQNNNQQTALLVMDVQGATVGMLNDSAPFIHAVSQAIEKARSNKIPVIYVVIGFRKGLPEISPDNKSFSAHKKKRKHEFRLRRSHHD